jgi:YfiH family protein
MNSPSYINFPIFDHYPELFCIFSTRIGGFSKNEYSTMNMGLTSGDKIDIVNKNRKHLFKMLKVEEEKLAISKQIHSAFVKKVTKPGVYTDTDALFTNRQDFLLSVQTADCLPVFMYDPNKKVIAAIHAGWQGSLRGIVSETLALVIKEYAIHPNNLKIAIGPGIQGTCFELREDVFSQFPNQFLKMHENKETKYLDLQSFIKSQLVRCGVIENNIYIDTTCTHCDDKRFYSYRRNKNKSGRMIGIIGFKNVLST